MLTNKERLLQKLKDTNTIGMHVTTTRNMNAMLKAMDEVKVVDGEIVLPPMPDYVPWHQDDEVIAEVLRALDAIENGDFEEVDIDAGIEYQTDIVKLTKLMDEGKTFDEASELSRIYKKDKKSFDVV